MKLFEWDCSFLTTVSFVSKTDGKGWILGIKSSLFPFCLFPSPFRAVGDATLLSLLFPFLMPSYRSNWGKSYLAKKGLCAWQCKSFQERWVFTDRSSSPTGKCFTADPQGSQFPETLLISCRKIFSRCYTDRLYKWERSRLESLLQRCSHTSLASSVLPYFEAVSLHLDFLQN